MIKNAARLPLPSSDRHAELDCFLQVEGATGADAEEIATTLSALAGGRSGGGTTRQAPCFCGL